MPVQILCVFIGCVSVYASLFSIGSFVYGQYLTGIGLGCVAIIGAYFLLQLFGKLRAD